MPEDEFDLDATLEGIKEHVPDFDLESTISQVAPAAKQLAGDAQHAVSDAANSQVVKDARAKANELVSFNDNPNYDEVAAARPWYDFWSTYTNPSPKEKANTDAAFQRQLDAATEQGPAVAEQLLSPWNIPKAGLNYLVQMGAGALGFDPRIASAVAETPLMQRAGSLAEPAARTLLGSVSTGLSAGADALARDASASDVVSATGHGLKAGAGLVGGLEAAALAGQRAGTKMQATANRKLAERAYPEADLTETRSRKGDAGVAQAGQELRDQGLTRPRGPFDYFKGVTNDRMSANAVDTLDRASKQLAASEENMLSAPTGELRPSGVAGELEPVTVGSSAIDLPNTRGRLAHGAEYARYTKREPAANAYNHVYSELTTPYGAPPPAEYTPYKRPPRPQGLELPPDEPMTVEPVSTPAVGPVRTNPLNVAEEPLPPPDMSKALPLESKEALPVSGTADPMQFTDMSPQYQPPISGSLSLATVEEPLYSMEGRPSVLDEPISQSVEGNVPPAYPDPTMANWGEQTSRPDIMSRAAPLEPDVSAPMQQFRSDLESLPQKPYAGGAPLPTTPEGPLSPDMQYMSDAMFNPPSPEVGGNLPLTASQAQRLGQRVDRSYPSNLNFEQQFAPRPHPPASPIETVDTTAWSQENPYDLGPAPTEAPSSTPPVGASSYTELPPDQMDLLRIPQFAPSEPGGLDLAKEFGIPTAYQPPAMTSRSPWPLAPTTIDRTNYNWPGFPRPIAVPPENKVFANAPAPNAPDMSNAIDIPAGPSWSGVRTPRDAYTTKEALDTRRAWGNTIKNFYGRQMNQVTPEREEAVLEGWKGMGDDVKGQLAGAAESGMFDPAEFERWKAANKTFSTVADVSKNLARSVNRSNKATPTGRETQFGKTYALADSLINKMGGINSLYAEGRGLESLGEGARQLSEAQRIAHPDIEKARRENPNAPRAQIEQEASQSMKDKLFGSWYTYLKDAATKYVKDKAEEYLP